MISEVVQSVITRPSNTTAYTSGDVVDAGTGAGLTFSNAVRKPGDKGIITGAQVILSANQATLPSLELWIFDQALTAYDDDNAAFTPTDADLTHLLGILTFPLSAVGDATSGAGGNAVVSTFDRLVPFETASNSRHLYGVLVVRNAYTPVADSIFTVNLRILQDD